MEKLELDVTNSHLRPLKDLEYLEYKISQIHYEIKKQNNAKIESLKWLNYPSNYDKDPFLKMHGKAQEWKRNGVKTVIVIGANELTLGIKAAYDFMFQDYTYNEPDIKLLFLSSDLSTDELIHKLSLVNETKFAIIVISHSGNTIETLFNFKEVHNILTKKEETNASSYVVTISENEQGQLFKYSVKNNYTSFKIPDKTPTFYSIFTTVGIFPLMCAGVDVALMLKSAAHMQEELDNPKLTQNQAYLYAASRHFLNTEQNYLIEKIIYPEPRLKSFTSWIQQLIANSLGKEGKGTWPNVNYYNNENSQKDKNQKNKIFFQTMLICNNPLNSLIINTSHKKYDLLNYLNNLEQKIVLEPTYDILKYDIYDTKNNTPTFLLKFDSYNEQTLGALFTFFHNSLVMHAYLLGLNPFEQPAIEVFRNNFISTLNKTNN